MQTYQYLILIVLAMFCGTSGVKLYRVIPTRRPRLILLRAIILLLFAAALAVAIWKFAY